MTRLRRWVAATVLALFPRHFRAQHGEELVDFLFARSHEIATRRGRIGVICFWARNLADVVGAALNERRETRRRRGRRRTWSAAPLSGLVPDVRYALRGMRRNLGFTLGVMSTLALGIGATTVIVSVVDGVLLRPLPYPEPDRIVGVHVAFRGGRGDEAVSYPDFIDWKEQTSAFDPLVLATDWTPTITGGGERAEPVTGMIVSHDFLGMFGMEPGLGRGFLPGDDVSGADRVVVLSHGFWQRRFGGDVHAVGQVLTLDGADYAVVGIGPERFADILPGFGPVSVYRPMRYSGLPADSLPGRGYHAFLAFGRMRPGITLQAAHDQIVPVAADLERRYPASNEGKTVRLIPIRDAWVDNARVSLLVFLGAVAFVLAIAVTNVVNLLIARTAERGRELALRVAIGAGRLRLVQQLATETVILAIAGGGLGIVLAYYVTDLVVAWSAGSIPMAAGIRVDARVLAITSCVVIAVGVLTGIATGLYAVRSGIQGSAGRWATAGRSRIRARGALVVTEIALAVTLLIGAGLLIRSFWNLSRVDPGFEQGVVTFRVSPTYEEMSRVNGFYADLLAQVKTLPGVSDAATVGSLPLSDRRACGTLASEENPTQFAGEDMCAEVRPITPEYFSVMAIPLLQGRLFGEMDHADAPDVVIINHTTAELLWPGSDPIGRRLRTGLGDRRHEVVGVVADVKQYALDESAPPQTYLPDNQWSRRTKSVVVRATIAPDALLPAFRRIVAAIDSDIPVTELGTLEASVSRVMGGPRFRTMLLGAFAAVACLLALIGIYGVVSFSVAQRHHELAIRLSLGATPRGVLSLVLREGLRLVVAGVSIGIVAALAVGQTLASLLFGVARTDALSYALVTALMLVVAGAAAAVPAIRATRVHPMEALQSD